MWGMCREGEGKEDQSGGGFESLNVDLRERRLPAEEMQNWAVEETCQMH